MTLEPLRCIVTANASVGREAEEFDIEVQAAESRREESSVRADAVAPGRQRAGEATNDTVLALATGLVDVDQTEFTAALATVCKSLAEQITAKD